MSEFLMKPRIDFAFKEIMMNENARTGFLSAVLKIKPEDIKETKILNTYLRKEYKEANRTKSLGRPLPVLHFQNVYRTNPTGAKV